MRICCVEAREAKESELRGVSELSEARFIQVLEQEAED